MYTLEYPWLLALAALPVLIRLLLPAYKEEQVSVRLPFFTRLVAAAGLRPAPGAIILRPSWPWRVVSILCWLLLVLALARPAFVEPPIQKIEPARDLLLALDISQSMETKDFVAPDGNRIARIEAVKRVVGDFIKRRKGDRIGLIVFGTAAYPEAPLTLDHESCRQLLDQTQAGMAGPQTMVGDAIGLAIKEFDRSKTKERLLILLTDGNDTGSRMPPAKAAEIAHERGVKIHTVAIGNPQATGEERVDLGLLRSIAKTTGGEFFLGQDEKQLSGIYATLDRITVQNYKTYSYRPKRQLFQYPLAAAVIAALGYHLLAQLWSVLRRLYSSRQVEEIGA
ncbi:MAG TPA: VWA domain-containing protein [Bryobacteraceae bacterium]